MNELREELASEPKSKTRKLFSRQFARVLLLFLMIVVSAVYIGNLLFGANSYSTILFLEDQKDTINQEVENLKQQNAKYQKEYFELKRIGGDK